MNGQNRSHDERAKSVDLFLERMNISLGMESDPSLFDDILVNVMCLGQCEPVRQLLAEALESPISLRPMLEEIRAAIIKRHPAILDFLQQVSELGLIVPVRADGDRQALVKMIHHTYLLEQLTKEIVRNVGFMQTIHAFLTSKRHYYGVRVEASHSLEDLIRLYGSTFIPTKTFGIDISVHAKLKSRLRGFLTPEESSKERTLKWNIMEAVITDTASPENGMAGIAMAEIQPDRVTLTEDTKAFQYHFSPEWASLYESWNLAFVTGNMPHLDILYPKLLIPSVINAESYDYVFARLVALWLSLSFHIFATAQKKVELLVPRRATLSKLWGKINYEYGKALLRSEKGLELDNFRHLAKVNMSDFMRQILKMMAHSHGLSEVDCQRLVVLYEKST